MKTDPRAHFIIAALMKVEHWPYAEKEAYKSGVYEGLKIAEATPPEELLPTPQYVLSSEKMDELRGLVRSETIEEVAKEIEAAPLTYYGPDPHVVSDLRYLIVCVIRDMKAGVSPLGSREPKPSDPDYDKPFGMTYTE